MHEPRFARARHARVAAALGALNGTFLGDCQCWFGGGTRIVLELGEYRESEDVDFLCASAPGYRALRSAIDDRSLGKITAKPLALLREVRADRYGIRTVLESRDALGGDCHVALAYGTTKFYQENPKTVRVLLAHAVEDVHVDAAGEVPPLGAHHECAAAVRLVERGHDVGAHLAAEQVERRIPEHEHAEVAVALEARPLTHRADPGRPRPARPPRPGAAARGA